MLCYIILFETFNVKTIIYNVYTIVLTTIQLFIKI